MRVRVVERTGVNGKHIGKWRIYAVGGSCILLLTVGLAAVAVVTFLSVAIALFKRRQF